MNTHSAITQELHRPNTGLTKPNTCVEQTLLHKRHTTGLPKGLKIPSWIHSIIDDDDDDDLSDEDDEDGDEDNDEDTHAKNYLQALSWLNEESEEYKDWYLDQLNDRQEFITRTNMEPQDIKKLIKEMMKQ